MHNNYNQFLHKFLSLRKTQSASIIADTCSTLIHFCLSSIVACKDDNFLCNNGKCILSTFVCNNINDCGDNSDEPDSCDPSVSDTYFGLSFGKLFGAIAGLLLLITGIIIAVLLTCVYNKKCLLYKQRRRRDQPPVVIIEPHEENIQENASLINRYE